MTYSKCHCYPLFGSYISLKAKTSYLINYTWNKGYNCVKLDFTSIQLYIADVWDAVSYCDLVHGLLI